MTNFWKTVVIVSLSLNLACLVALSRMSDVFLDAQKENLGLFLQLSGDQQELRRELNAHRAESGDALP